MNPRTPTRQNLKLYIPTFENSKRKFIRYLRSKQLSENYIKDLANKLDKYFLNVKIYTPDQLSQYLQKVNVSHFNIAIRVYLNYLSDNGFIEEDVAIKFKKVIRGKGSQPDMYVPTDKIVRQAYNDLTEKRFKTVFKILAFSGIRTSEVVKFLTNYDEKRLIVSGKIAKYPLNFIRGQKRSYFVYMPTQLKEELHGFYINRKQIYDRLNASGLNPKYLRKWFYNFLIYNNVPESVADFIEGRATQTVGSLLYLSRAKQADFWYNQIVTKLKGVLQ